MPDGSAITLGEVCLGEAASEDFADLVQRQSGFVFRVAYAALRETAAAEDVVQETFLKLHRNGGWRGVRDERAFLARVAWRLAQDRRSRVSFLELDAEQPAAGVSPEAAAIQADLHARVRAIVATLPAHYRDPLLLSTSGELNSREIAAAMGMAEGTVRANILRARQMVRARIGEEEGNRG